MAQRIASAPPAGAPQAAADNTDELQILHPERQLTLGGEAVTVREYGNLEWLRLLVRAEPLVAAIAAALQASSAPTYEQALAVIAEHADALLPLVAQAADRPLAWIDQLPAGDVELLLMTWWGVNAHFFVQRAINRLAVAHSEQQVMAQAAQRAPSAWAGAPSTPP